MKEGDPPCQLVIQKTRTWNIEKTWTPRTWALALGTRVVRPRSWCLDGSRYTFQSLVVVSKHGWAKMCQKASNVLQCHHHRRVYSVLTLSSARWDPSAHDVVSQHSSPVRMLGECCPTSRDLAQSVVIALIQHFATSEKPRILPRRLFADPWKAVRAKFKQAW